MTWFEKSLLGIVCYLSCGAGYFQQEVLVWERRGMVGLYVRLAFAYMDCSP